MLIPSFILFHSLNLGATCIAEYSSSGNSSASTACACRGLPGLSYSSCTSCLETNSPTLAQGLQQLSTFCTDFIKQCKYECDFATCNSSDVACQCKESYLQNIYKYATGSSSSVADCPCLAAHHATLGTGILALLFYLTTLVRVLTCVVATTTDKTQRFVTLVSTRDTLQPQRTLRRYLRLLERSCTPVNSPREAVAQPQDRQS